MVSAELVKKLREKTGAGMMVCKEALKATEGDFEEAIQWLRKKGMASAAKKAGRATQEGLIGALAEGNFGVALEINCETDFVARNEQFLSFAKELLTVAFANHVTSLEELEKCSFSKKNVTAKEAITEAIAKLGENIVIRRIGALSVSPGRVVSYIHNARKPSLGKIAILVALESSASSEILDKLGKELAMHVAALRPAYIQITDVPEHVLQKERGILKEQALDSGRPENIIEKMVEGRLRKYFEEMVLEEQNFILEPSKTVKAAVKEAEKDSGTPIRIVNILRFSVGEEISTQDDCFIF